MLGLSSASIPWFQIFFTIGITMFGVVTGIIGYFLKDIRSSVKEKQENQDKKIDAVAKELNEFKAEMPKEYVLRDDFIREVSGLHLKIDRIGRDISNIGKAVAKLAGGNHDESE